MSSYRRDKSRAQALASEKKDGVHYLRVSSVRQTHTAVDIDKDGNSIATQREECNRKAADMGVDVIKEFIEPGKSAQTIDKRPEFRALLAFLAANPTVGYVFVYSRSRAFRNVEDAILTRKHLRGLGVKIISTKEDFGDSIEAEFMEVISDTMNDLQNKRNGEDIKMKMAHKAKNGGTIGRAPIGYLNARVDMDGRMVNTVIVDDKRAPVVRLAFELYATGDYSMDALQEAMEDHGLCARPAGRWKVERPLSVNTLHRMLGDPYYAGYTVHEGELYDGRHQALVEQELFDRVQDVLDTRSARGTRDRVLQHYLKGMPRCERCHKAGRERRLLYTEVKGNGGTYGYFLCRGRQDREGCELPYLPAAKVEQQIVEFYRHLKLTTDYATEFVDALGDALADSQRLSRDVKRNLNKELAALDDREQQLVTAIEYATLSHSVVRDRMNQIRHQRASVQLRIAEVDTNLDTGARVLTSTIDLSRDPQTLYRDATDEARGQINQAFFRTLYLDNHGSVAEAVLTDPFMAVHDAHRAWLKLTTPSRGLSKTKKAPCFMKRF